MPKIEEKKLLRCVVAGYDSDGNANFHFCKVLCTEEQISSGEHWTTARFAAVRDGFREDSLVVYDETICHPTLLQSTDWNKVGFLTVPNRSVSLPRLASGPWGHLPSNWAEIFGGDDSEIPVCRVHGLKRTHSFSDPHGDAETRTAWANLYLIRNSPSLLSAAKDLLWPNVPSADDVALMIIGTSGNDETRKEAMVLVENLRKAQARAREVLSDIEPWRKKP